MRYLASILIIISLPLFGQEIDTGRIARIHTLEMRIDSLIRLVDSLDTQLQEVKQRTVEGERDVEELISLLNEGDVESADLNSRSRRQRVNALLEAITQRPGRLRFNGGATAILQHAWNDTSEHTTATGSFDIYAHTAFSPNTLLFIDLEAIGGYGPDEFYKTFSGLNDDAGSTQSDDGIDRLNVLEAWVEFQMLKKTLTITAGKIDLTNYFDNNASANDETMQFISSAFVNSSAFSVPQNSPGFCVRTTLLNRFHLQAGLASVHNSGSDILTDIYRIASVGYTLLPDSDFESNVRIYGYQHPLADYDAGWGISFDALAFGSFNVFGRYGKNDPEPATLRGIKSAWSAGLRFVRNIAGQPAALGVAYGENRSIHPDLNDEKLIEIYARRQINEWIHISPHGQIVWDVRGTSGRLAVVGFRTHFNF